MKMDEGRGGKVKANDIINDFLKKFLVWLRSFEQSWFGRQMTDYEKYLFAEALAAYYYHKSSRHPTWAFKKIPKGIRELIGQASKKVWGELK